MIVPGPPPERSADRGALAIVLHTHMPYVEGYGTWPFGEEWLWEALATCYLPLAALLEEGAPLTVSLTPVLADQLEAPGVAERFATFLETVRRKTHRLDAAGCRASGRGAWAEELERAAGDYEWALAEVERRDGDLLGALAPHVAWTSAATHAILPLLATDRGIALQLETGIAAHRIRFDRGGRRWQGGFWLPECAYAPSLDAALAAAGVTATVVDLTDLLGYGDLGHLRPIATADGPMLYPLDRATVELVWSDGGYPAHGAYRDYHAFTVHHHRVWNNAGATYHRAAAEEQARIDATDFVARTIDRLDRGAEALGQPALAVCAIDTELFGHWWYEGVVWLAAVVAEAERQGLALAQLDGADHRFAPIPAAAVTGGAPLPTTTWGTPRDLSTWDGPAVAEIAWRLRAAELETLIPAGEADRLPPLRAQRELLALQASDWAFQVSRGLAGPYPEARSAGHAAALEQARAAGDRPGDRGAVANLAPFLRPIASPPGATASGVRGRSSD